jgi:glyoxylase-like metal-dependent hydrolase (beta-lactamase superfamily II)
MERAMEIHHLNCGTIHGIGFPPKDGRGGFLKRGRGVIHCLLVDTGAGLALVDTGWGIRDYTDPSPTVRLFTRAIGCPCDPRETAIRQVEALGYDPVEVQHILMTHMHLDHAGGLPDFPWATVHLLADELEGCLRPRTLMEWGACRREHRAHGPRWQPHRVEGDRWFGLDCTPPIRVGEAEFVMIPFPGHTRGTCAVALRLGARWLVHCGDVYTYYRQVDPVQPYTHPCGAGVEAALLWAFHVPKRHWLRLRALLRAHGDEVEIFCGHDAHEFDLLSAGGAGWDRESWSGALAQS